MALLGIGLIAQVFKDVADAMSPDINTFIYGQVWDNNGSPSNNTPTILLEAQPDWTTEGLRPSARSVKKEYSLKVFGFDTYHFEEQAVKPLWEVQGELEDLFERYIATVIVALQAKQGWSVTVENNGFHGFYPSHNSKLLQVYQGLRVKIPAPCVI